MNKLIEFFTKQKLFGNLLTLFVFILGIAATFMTRREVFPNVNFDILVVDTVFPGAGPDEIEKLVTNPLEQDLKEVTGIKKMRSASVENLSQITLWLDPDQTNEQEAKADVQDVIDQFTKPEGAESPKVMAIKSDLTPIIEVSLMSNEISEFELRKEAKELEKELENISGVAKIVAVGVRDLEYKVEVNPTLLAQQKLSLDEVISALKSQNVSIPAGTLEAKTVSITDQERMVRTIGEFKTIEDVMNTVIRANDFAKTIRVRDIAKVSQGLEKSQVINRTNGAPSMSLTVLKKEKSDAVTVVERIKAFMQVKAPELKTKKIEYSMINDLSSFIDRRIGILSGNLIVGLILVFVVLTLVLRVRVALLVSLGIPFAFLGAMIVFYQFDMSLNLISLLGFIIVSGMLVDDAIVVMDSAARRIEAGESPETAAIKGTQEIWKAVSASVLTTVIAFAPMLFMSGIFGKFVRQIPAGVILALLVSLFEAYFVLPQHIAEYIRRKDFEPIPKEKLNFITRISEGFKAFWDHRVTPAYGRMLRKFVFHKWKTVGATALFFILSLVVAGTSMKFILFPPEGIEIFFIRLTGPSGSSLELTQKFMDPIEAKVKALPSSELKNYVTNIGFQMDDPNDPNAQRGSHVAQIVVYLHPEENRKRSAAEVIEALKKDIVKPKEVTSITFSRAGGGPPVGKPISVAIRGEAYPHILKAVKELEEKVKKLPGALDVTNTYVEGKEEIQIKVNSAEAKAAQLTVAQVGSTVRAAFDGVVATTIQNLDEEVKVRVSFPKENRSSLESLKKIEIPNFQGQLIPLSSISTQEVSRGITVYEHENNQREVRIVGEIDTNLSSANIMSSEIAKFFPELQKKYPDLFFTFGGEDEDTQESMESLKRAFIVAVIGILFVLILTFGSLLQPLLVLVSIPFGLIGVIWAFFIHGLPLSFMGLLGVVALAGVIVNNAIVFIDAVNQERAAGLKDIESIIVAATTRLRPIFLTTFTTVCGLMPTAYGLGGLDKFVVPIAMSLGWGLAVGSILTLFVLPPAFAILDVLLAKSTARRSA